MPESHDTDHGIDACGDQLAYLFAAGQVLLSPKLASVPNPRTDNGLREIAALWRRHGAAFTARWIDLHPMSRPWAWWQFDAPEDWRKAETADDYLIRLDLLTATERAALSDTLRGTQL